MYTNYPFLNAKSFICIAAAGACAILAGSVRAQGHEVQVSVPVSTAGLDISQPAGAREAYRRIQRAARIACTSGDRVGLEAASSFTGCYEKALGDTVRAAHRPQLSIVYLETHTPLDAATYSIDVPVRMASE